MSADFDFRATPVGGTASATPPRWSCHGVLMKLWHVDLMCTDACRRCALR